MANERERRLMQQALDDELSAEALQELYSRLNAAPEDADTFSRLRSVDRLLKAAPLERAPRSLALRIMARVAEELRNPSAHPRSSLALAIGLGLAALTLVPLLVGFVSLLLTSLGSATFFNAIMQGIAGVAAAGAAALEAVVAGAQAILSQSPAVPIAMLSLIPVGLIWLARLSRIDFTDGSDEE